MIQAGAFLELECTEERAQLENAGSDARRFVGKCLRVAALYTVHRAWLALTRFQFRAERHRRGATGREQPGVDIATRQRQLWPETGFAFISVLFLECTSSGAIVTIMKASRHSAVAVSESVFLRTRDKALCEVPRMGNRIR